MIDNSYNLWTNFIIIVINYFKINLNSFNFYFIIIKLYP
jgi:hypothetical protein